MHLALYNHTVAAVKETQLPYLIIDETQQYGNGFAEKFCNAIEYCFGKGFQKIITVGSDCATLKASDLLAADRQLQHNNSSIGADVHGGFFMLALQRKFYRRNAFLQFNWGSKQLSSEIKAFFTNVFTQDLLVQGCGTDINSTKDLAAVVAKKNTPAFFRLLRFLITSFFEYRIIPSNAYSFHYANSLGLRGPPSLVL